MKKKIKISLFILLIFCACFVSLLIIESNGNNLRKLMIDKVLKIANIKISGNLTSAEEDEETEELFVPYHTGYTLLKSGRLKEFSDKKRIISEKIYVEPNSIYYFKNLSAKYGNSFYVIYDEDNKVISYLGTSEDSEGEVIESKRVVMPADASYFRIACDLNVNNKMFTLSKVKEKIDNSDTETGEEDTGGENSGGENTDTGEGNTGTGEGNTDNEEENNDTPKDENSTEQTKKIDPRTISSLESLEEIEVKERTGYVLLKNGKLQKSSDKNRIVSELIYAEPNGIYYFENISTKYGNSFYVIYDENDNVLRYLSTKAESKGDVIDSIRVIMPSNAKYFRVAYDKNINTEKFIVKKSTAEASLNKTTGEPAIISFIDDDCRDGYKAVYQEETENFFNLIKRLDIPYSVACPLNNMGTVKNKYDNAGNVIGKYTYFSMGDLVGYYNEIGGINVLSHHLTEESMTKDYESFEQYQSHTIQLINGFRNNGIELSGIAYPNGHIKPDFMSVVKENYKFGFTVDREINALPYESHYIHRYELFPTNGIYDLEYAKNLVKQVADNGGWLVFMTHNWYSSFSASDLETLVNYIRSEEINLPILNVETVTDNYSNSIEMGLIKKPFNAETDDFFVVDALGRVSTNNTLISNLESNNMKIYDKSPYKWEEITVDYNTTSSIGDNGYLKTPYKWEEIGTLPLEEQIKLKKQNVSVFIPVTAGNKYKLANLSAEIGNCFYAFYDSKYNALESKGLADETTGKILMEKIITIPKGAEYMRIASNLNIYDKMFKLYRVANTDETNTSPEDNTTSNSTTDSTNSSTNSSAIPSTDTTTTNVKGDLNSDGKVTNDDISILYLYINGVCEFTDEELSISDVNNDGKVNNKDWNKLYNTINVTN